MDIDESDSDLSASFNPSPSFTHSISPSPSSLSAETSQSEESSSSSTLSAPSSRISSKARGSSASGPETLFQPDDTELLQGLLAKELSRLVPILVRVSDSEAPPIPLVEVRPSPPCPKGELSGSNLRVLYLSVNFKEWKYLKNAYWTDIGQSEEVRELTRKIVVSLLDALMDFGLTFHAHFVFTELIFRHTEASMRAVFNGTRSGRPVHRETEVRVLDMSHTKTSAQALVSLHRLRNLRELYLDYCPSLIKSGKKVFTLLTKHDPIPRLELLSVIGTSSSLSHDWLSKIELSCPRLTKIYFTRKKGAKALGWQDVIMLQTVRDPHLLPCGHIGDLESLRRMNTCSLDRRPFSLDNLVKMSPSMSFLEKQSNASSGIGKRGDAVGEKSGESELQARWTVQFVDHLRKPLEAKCLFHVTCGTFYNFGTVQELYTITEDAESIDNSLVFAMMNFRCMRCKNKFNNLRVVYPHSNDNLDDQNFSNLSQLGAYSLTRRQI